MSGLPCPISSIDFIGASAQYLNLRQHQYDISQGLIIIMELEKQKEVIGNLKNQFSSQILNLSVGSYSLAIEMFGPSDFLTNMPLLFNKVKNNFPHGSRIFQSLYKSNKPISVIYELDRLKIGAGVITEDQWFTPWWNIYSKKFTNLSLCLTI